MQTPFGLVLAYVRKDPELYEKIRKGKELKDLILLANIAIVFNCVMFGAVMGTYTLSYQVAHNAIKIPALFLFALYVTIPTTYIISTLAGNKLKLGQTILILSLSVSVMSLVMVGFVPLAMLFYLTTQDYTFVVFLTMFIASLAGFLGLSSLIRGFRATSKDQWKAPSAISTVVLSFAGTQIVWLLRPFFHVHSEFIRPVKSNFYIAMFDFMAENQAMSIFFIVMFAVFGIIFGIIAAERYGLFKYRTDRQGHQSQLTGYDPSYREWNYPGYYGRTGSDKTTQDVNGPSPSEGTSSG